MFPKALKSWYFPGSLRAMDSDIPLYSLVLYCVLGTLYSVRDTLCCVLDTLHGVLDTLYCVLDTNVQYTRYLILACYDVSLRRIS